MCLCVRVAVEKFELAGASTTDIGVMIKNHCSNETAMGEELVTNVSYSRWLYQM